VTHRTLAFAILLAFVGSACSGLGGRGGFDREALSERQTVEERARIIESLAPEDTPISRTRLAAVVEAMATVIKDIDKDLLSPTRQRGEKGASGCEPARSQTDRTHPAVDRKKEKTGGR
jgi:hypothetical protein